MRPGKETLGFASRTEAVLALQATGLGNREIAQKIGVSSSTVSALLASARRSGAAREVARNDCEAGQPQKRSFAALEAAIMDHWDAGKRAEEIAALTETKLRTVRSVLGYMREGAAEERLGKMSIKMSSAALLAAIRRHHPERCGR